VQDIASVNPAAAESHGIVVVVDLEHPSADVPCILAEEAFDVIAIDRRAAIEAEAPTYRRNPLEITEATCSEWDGVGSASCSTKAAGDGFWQHFGNPRTKS
jgi:hypothetical protein